MRSLCNEAVSTILAVATACVACSAAPDEHPTLHQEQSAITHGTADDGDPAVVALLVDGSIACTGVLVAPMVVATAAHCVDPVVPNAVLFGSRLGAGTVVAVKSARSHPHFDGDTLANDFGLVRLASVAPVAPVPLIEQPIDDSFVGKPLRIVGFGSTGSDTAGVDESSEPRKRSGTTTIDAVDASEFSFHPAPSQTCKGDSGGPAFVVIDGREWVAGVTSSGDLSCKLQGYDARADRYLDFAHRYIADTDATAEKPATGGCSFVGVPRSAAAPGTQILLALAALAALCRRASAFHEQPNAGGPR